MSIIIKRLIPYIVPLLIFIGIEISFAKPNNGWIFLIIVLVIGFASFIFIVKDKLNKKNAQLLLPGVLFLLTFTSFFFLLVFASSVFKHIFAIIAVIFLGVALEIIFQLFYDRQKISVYFDFFSYLNLITIFMGFVSLGSAGVFLGVSNWILLVIAAILLLLVFHSNYYLVSLWKNEDSYDFAGILSQKIENLISQSKVQKILYTLIPAFVLIEIFWALSFLPTGFYVNSFILTVCYYVIFGLIKNCLNNSLNKKIVKRYAVIGGACLLLIIFTARV